MRKPRLLLIGLTLLLLPFPEATLAQQGGGYEITNWTVDGGGGKSASSSYALVGTIGQPDAGQAMTGSSYRLVGGFWGGAVGGVVSPVFPHTVYLPLALRNQ